MERIIKKAAVLGSGAMGSQIACHFANIGLEVLLLDIVPDELTEEEEEKGLSLKDKKVRDRIARENLKKALEKDPSPIYDKDYAAQITTGNFEDDLEKIAGCDWILEAVLEKLEIKQELFEKVEKHRKQGSIVTTNTSGIPIHELIKERTEDFQKHFCGTHFFNPPRYLELLEIIPSEETDSKVVDFLADYCDVYLGKTTVICKDTPAFIGNRIGVYAIMLTIKLMREMELSIEQVDELTGKAVGRPKTATFRTADLVGVDILVDVADGMYERLEDDEEREVFKVPDFIRKMVDKGWVGDKVKQGFYKKEKENGETKLYTLEPDKMEYRSKKDPDFLIVEEQKKKDNLEEQFRSFVEGKVEETNIFKRLYLRATGSDNDKAVKFFNAFFHRFLAYCSRRLPEISDDIYRIDEAIKAGFSWKAGPFEIWDMLGVEETLEKMKEEGYEPADWVQEMLNKGITSFYETADGVRKCYDIQQGAMQIIPRSEKLIFLDNYRKDHTVWQNSSSNIIHIDSVLVVEFTSKKNSINLDVIAGIEKAIELAETEKDYKAVVIGNEADDFSLGADIRMIGKYAIIRNTGKIDEALQQFQDLMLKIRYSHIPVIVAPQGKTLGGGCELCLYADRVQAAAETYMGLVEVGVGLIPAGGGTTEMIHRATGEMIEDAPDTTRLQRFLENISKAEVAKSPAQAYDLGYLRRDVDQITMNKKRLLTDARDLALQLAKDYTPPRKAGIKALGRNALSYYLTGITIMHYGNYMTDYDREIVEKLAYVMTGGGLTGKQELGEEYFMKLEREAFLELVTNFKTMERMGSMLMTGKPKRN